MAALVSGTVRPYVVRTTFGQGASVGYLVGVSDLTTVKVPPEVRDRLATAAQARGLSVRALLDELSREAVDAALMERAGQQMARLRETDPDAWDDYLAEGRVWDEGASDPVDA